MTPLAGFDVSLPQSSTRGAVPRHSEEETQPAPSTPSRTQRENPPRLSQIPTQPMDWTPTSAKDDGTTGTTPPRHSQENTQPAPPQITGLYTQYWERLSQEATPPLVTNADKPTPTKITDLLDQHQQAEKDQTMRRAHTRHLHPLCDAPTPAAPFLALYSGRFLPSLDHTHERRQLFQLVGRMEWHIPRLERILVSRTPRQSRRPRTSTP